MTVENKNELVAHDISIEKAKILAHSDLLPPAFQKKPANIIVALDIAKELEMSPLMVMQNIYIIHGKPSFSSSFILALLYRSKEFTSIEFEFGDDDKKCRVVATKERGGGRRMVTGPWVSLEIARAEGWLSKPGSKWKTMPDLMLRYRAATFFCRTCAPHLLLGFKTADEISDIHDGVPSPSSSSSYRSSAASSPKKVEIEKVRKTIDDILRETSTPEYDDDDQ